MDEFDDRCHPDGQRATFRARDHRAIPWQNSRAGEGKTHFYHSGYCAWSLAFVIWLIQSSKFSKEKGEDFLKVLGAFIECAHAAQDGR